MSGCLPDDLVAAFSEPLPDEHRITCISCHGDAGPYPNDGWLRCFVLCKDCYEKAANHWSSWPSRILLMPRDVCYSAEVLERHLGFTDDDYPGGP